MADVKTQLLNVLGEIKGSGSFVSSDAKAFLFPGLAINGVDEIGFPINAAQAKEMIKVAHKAPFGKGSETVLDAAVRSAWEIDAAEITFYNKNWGTFIDGIIAEIKPALGIGEYPVTANLYKLLIYETGDFFLPHKDSEKEQGMFGTLIVGLPSKHEGGELLVRFDGREEVVDFSGPASQYKIPFAAFYADCEHEIKPITGGTRVCLVYNLIQTKGTEKIALNPSLGYAQRLAAILQSVEDDNDMPKIVLLGHQYTPANFTMDALKLNDRPKAEALMQAAQLAGYYAKLGLVTSYQTGELVADMRNPSRKSYRRSYYDDEYGDDDLVENGTMGEVLDEHTLNEGEPVEKEAEGYTGNAGMEMQYWYHYGAVFLWPKKQHYSMLQNLAPDNKLEWIGYYNKQWGTLGAADMALAKQLAEACMQVNEWRKADFTPMVDWLINIHNHQYLQNTATPFLANHFTQVTLEGWVKLFEAYPPRCIEGIFSTVAMQGKPTVVNHLLGILTSLLSNNTDAYVAFVLQQINQLPIWLNAARLCDSDGQAEAKNILRQALAFAQLKAEDDAWQKNTAAAFAKELNREYVNEVLLATAMDFGKKPILATQIMAACKADLQLRVDNKPQPPADWSRAVPASPDYYKKVWDLLTAFLESPALRVYDYARPQAQRSEMERAISSATVDLTMETIKKGSPHTLRLTKTQAAYERALTKWKTDVELLKKARQW